MISKERIARWTAILALTGGATAISGEVFRCLECLGKYDWDYYFFQAASIYRSVVEFREIPLWNPWYMGGVPVVGNFQSLFPSPWFVIDLAVGPFMAIKLKIVAHYVIGVLGMYWMSRQLGLSRLASVYASGTFFFSTWLALRVHSGHFTYLSTAYLPYVVGFLVRAQSAAVGRNAIWGGAFVALMILQGGVYDIIFTAFVLGPLALCWAIQGRTLRPLLVAALIGAWGVGLGAVKLVPVVMYMRENPRTVAAGGASLERYKQALTRPDLGDAEKGGPDSGRASRSDLPLFILKVFLGREQRSNTFYYPFQGCFWHECGAYIGPLAIVLLALSFLAWRACFPWLVVAAVCFATAAGNFAWFAPWTLLHRLPVFASMHASGRLFTPCVFAASVAAALALDGLRRRLGGWVGGERPRSWWLEGVVVLLVSAALADSVLTARFSIRDVFRSPAPEMRPRQPAIVTILGRSAPMTPAMMANYCPTNGYEPIEPNVWVKPREDPRYRGEVYFEPAESAAPSGRVELVGWSPNTVTVRTSCTAAGHVVLNRNWSIGWLTDPPYQAESFHGLIAARVKPGDHVIRFLYRPGAFLWGASVSLASLFLAATVCVGVMRREGRPNRVRQDTEVADQPATLPAR